MDSTPGFARRAPRLVRAIGVALVGIGLTSALGCGDGDAIWDAEAWDVQVTSTADTVLLSATIADVHGDFIHVSIRRDGYDSGYTIERSPGPNQPERDWSRVHHWFGELHPDTYLEGRIDDGNQVGPRDFQTFTYELPRGSNLPRQNFQDTQGSAYEYLVSGYRYADGNSGHPPFDAGTYQVEIYAWYTGSANGEHSAEGDFSGVQYIHYDRPLVSTTFELD